MQIGGTSRGRYSAVKGLLSSILIVILVLSGLGAGGASLHTPSLQRLSSLDDYNMVIIAPDSFSDSLQPLIDHKNLVGIQTFLKTTEDIYSTYEGRDKPEQIKYLSLIHI